MNINKTKQAPKQAMAQSSFGQIEGTVASLAAAYAEPASQPSAQQSPFATGVTKQGSAGMVSNDASGDRTDADVRVASGKNEVRKNGYRNDSPQTKADWVQTGYIKTLNDKED